MCCLYPELLYISSSHHHDHFVVVMIYKPKPTRLIHIKQTNALFACNMYIHTIIHVTPNKQYKRPRVVSLLSPAAISRGCSTIYLNPPPPFPPLGAYYYANPQDKRKFADTGAYCRIDAQHILVYMQSSRTKMIRRLMMHAPYVVVEPDGRYV